jgi:hypothetical protein
VFIARVSIGEVLQSQVLWSKNERCLLKYDSLKEKLETVGLIPLTVERTVALKMSGCRVRSCLVNIVIIDNESLQMAFSGVLSARGLQGWWPVLEQVHLLAWVGERFWDEELPLTVSGRPTSARIEVTEGL